MLVDIIPIKRFPKHVKTYTYQVPKELTKRIAVGQLVSIPLRSSQIYGIVLACYTPKQLLTHPVKSLLDIIQDEALVSFEYLQLWETYAAWYGISLASMTKKALLPLQKRKLSKLTLHPFPKNSTKNSHTETQSIYPTKDMRQTSIAEHTAKKGQTLLLVPGVASLEQVFDALDSDIQQHAVIFHAGLSIKEQFSRWIDIRNGIYTLIIGTRGSILLPFFDLQSIIIDEAHSIDHKHWDQNPRFDARDIAKHLAKIKNIPLTFITHSPSVDMLAHQENTEIPAIKELPTIIDMRSAYAKGHYSPFAPSVEQSLLDDQTQNVFFFLNRRGYAASLRCQDCGFVHTCPECDLPLTYHQSSNALHCHYCHIKKTIEATCPSCQSHMVKLRGGIGTELVEEALKKLLPERNIYRIDSAEIPEIDHTKPHIIIGTKRAMAHLDWDTLDRIVFLDIDRQLALPEYRAQEEIWHLIHEVAFKKTEHCEYIIQTRQADHVLFTALGNPIEFYKKELAARKTLGYPPYSYLIRYMYRHAKEDTAKASATKLLAHIQQQTNQANIQIKIQGPFALHPQYYRQQYWYALLVHIQTADWERYATSIHPGIPNDCTIDPAPYSILSPS
ncbi:primosomal protein N' [Patescibacteria group bacterium]|nr:primosomal protein N' [Patescibacteria group bacterium]MBU1721462.1 primosomal protein N' [Patescibacteria group bacterium]MBU1900781.1 primosomal protein N' [Patescibacteria group bacterium]